MAQTLRGLWLTIQQTTYGDLGKEMMSSEFACMTKVRVITPDLVPAPIAWGSYASIPHVHFLLCEFRPMTGEVPAAADLAEKIAELHRRSSTGDAKAMFGSDVPTFHGNVRVEHGWSHFWEEYFARTTWKLFELELETRVGFSFPPFCPWVHLFSYAYYEIYC